VPIQVESDSLEARIIKLLQDQDDAITLKEAAKKLNVSEKKLEKTVKSLASRGIVNIDVLPDKKYLRLGRSDIQLQGTKSSQKKAVKRKRAKQKDKGSKKSRDMMFG
jgi:DNA-binding Lrp family transcriptional regulator